jgi:hypothetical protein
MANFSDIATSLRVTTQLPLDHKRFSISQAELADLGDADNLAYTYYDNLKVYCWGEKTEWVWREVAVPETGTKLMASDFTYPNGIVYPNPGYSNKKYNFFKIVPGTDTKIISGINVTITGNGSTTTPYIINSTATYTPPASDIAPLQTINEGNGNGIIKRGRVSSNYGNIGLNAFDISTSYLPDLNGATGLNSFAQGVNVIASAENSVILGSNSSNSGVHSLVSGNNIDSSASYSTTLGVKLSSTGKGNTVLGVSNIVSGAGTTVVGQGAIIINDPVNTYNTTTKKLFVVGNGVIDDSTNSATSRSDAFVIYNSGVIVAPSLSMTEINDESTGKVLITREYLEDQISDIPIPTAIPYKSVVGNLDLLEPGPPTWSSSSPLQNEIGGSILWTKIGTGFYKGTLSGGPYAGVIDLAKTTCIIGSVMTTDGGLEVLGVIQTSIVPTGINLITKIGITHTDIAFSDLSIEIRFYQ